MNDELIPLSVLELDLPARDGWSLELTGVTVVVDDVGRRSVSRDDARRLIAEHRAWIAREEERLRRHREETERRAVEREREFRAQLHPGLPASMFAPGEDPIRCRLRLSWLPIRGAGRCGRS